jgi:hypothetical protein
MISSTSSILTRVTIPVPVLAMLCAYQRGSDSAGRAEVVRRFIPGHLSLSDHFGVAGNGVIIAMSSFSLALPPTA